MLRRRDTWISFSRNDGPHEACTQHRRPVHFIQGLPVIKTEIISRHAPLRLFVYAILIGRIFEPTLVAKSDLHLSFANCWGPADGMAGCR